MKYIQNTGRYAVAFTVVKNNRELKVALDRRRVYMDTGNVATTGITPVEEDVIKELKKQKRFNQMLESGDIEILDEVSVRTPEENKIKSLEEENRKLKEQLSAEASKADEKEMKALADENATLKAKLEALTAKKKNKASEGF